MKVKVKKYKNVSPIEFLSLRDRLGLKRYRKKVKREQEKKEILLNLGLKKMEQMEKDDFILIGYRRRRLKIP